MIKDITIGQYFTGHSPLHRMDPRVKLLLTIAYVDVYKRQPLSIRKKNRTRLLKEL